MPVMVPFAALRVTPCCVQGDTMFPLYSLHVPSLRQRRRRCAAPERYPLRPRDDPPFPLAAARALLRGSGEGRFPGPRRRPGTFLGDGRLQREVEQILAESARRRGRGGWSSSASGSCGRSPAVAPEPGGASVGEDIDHLARGARRCCSSLPEVYVQQIPMGERPVPAPVPPAPGRRGRDSIHLPHVKPRLRRHLLLDRGGREDIKAIGEQAELVVVVADHPTVPVTPKLFGGVSPVKMSPPRPI